MKSVLVSGCAGFIGFHASKRLLGYEVVGLDNLNPYYDEGLKNARLAILRDQTGIQFVLGNLADRSCVEKVFRNQKFGPVVHPAAQARYSLENPYVYVQINPVGFAHLIEEATGQRYLILYSRLPVQPMAPTRRYQKYFERHYLHREVAVPRGRGRSLSSRDRSNASGSEAALAGWNDANL